MEFKTKFVTQTCHWGNYKDHKSSAFETQFQAIMFLQYFIIEFDYKIRNTIDQYSTITNITKDLNFNVPIQQSLFPYVLDELRLSIQNIKYKVLEEFKKSIEDQKRIETLELKLKESQDKNKELLENIQKLVEDSQN